MPLSILLRSAVFSPLESVPTGNSVTCANNSSYPVKGVGQIVLTAANGSTFTLYDALYVPGIKKNLLAVSAFAKIGLIVKFVDERCTVHDLSSGDTIIASGLLCRGLYKLHTYGKCVEDSACVIVDSQAISGILLRSVVFSPHLSLPLQGIVLYVQITPLIQSKELD